jgi:hypothetical protein
MPRKTKVFEESSSSPGKGVSLPRGTAFDGNASNIPRPPALSEEEEERRLVETLSVPDASIKRNFHALQRMKVEKKDKHLKALDAFAKFLDTVSDGIETDLLKGSREVRDSLAECDSDLAIFYSRLEDEPYLVTLSIEQVNNLLDEVRGKAAGRSRQVDLSLSPWSCWAFPVSFFASLFLILFLSLFYRLKISLLTWTDWRQNAPIQWARSCGRSWTA